MKLRNETSHLDGIASIMVALHYEQHNPDGQICRISDTAEAYAAPNGNDTLEIAVSSQSISCAIRVSFETSSFRLTPL